MRLAVIVVVWAGAVAGDARVAAPASAPASTVGKILRDITEGRGEAALRGIAEHERELSLFDRNDLTGRACFVLKRYRQAVAALSSAVLYEPSTPDTHYLLGRAYEELGEYAQAIVAFEKAEFHGLNTAALHGAMARAYLHRGRLLGELQTQSTTGCVPGRLIDHFVVVRRGVAPASGCVLAGRDSALYRAARAVRLDEKSGELQLLLADIWAAAGIHAEACKAYERAAPLLPVATRGQCLQRWSDSLLVERQFDGYFARLREWMSLPGGLSAHELAERYARVAEAMRDGGDVARQVRYLTFAVEVEPDSAARHLALADALSWAGRLPDAARHWREALRIEPEHPKASEIRQRVKEVEEAKPGP